jgi:hypothetical protein
MASNISDTESRRFNFDDWSALAATDPEQFTCWRDKAIRQLIDNSTNVSTCRALQMMIDAERYTTGPGINASLRVLEQSIDVLRALEPVISRLNAELRALVK